MKMFRHLAVIAVLGLSAVDVSAQDFDKGLAAAEAGDYKTAIIEWQPLAENGDADAQESMGWMYQYGESIYGEGIPKDYTKAIKWYLMAAKQGNARAQLALGFLNLFGEGLPQNETEAISWIRLAAIQGDPSAQDALGNLYSSKDATLAHIWYNLGKV